MISTENKLVKKKGFRCIVGKKNKFANKTAKTISNIYFKRSG